MTCLDCENYKLRSATGQWTALAKHGFGQCKLAPNWMHYPPQHTCKKQKDAPEPVKAARIKWLNKLSTPAVSG